MLLRAAAVAALVAKRYEGAFNHPTREIGGGGGGFFLPEKSKQHFPIETSTATMERAVSPPPPKLLLARVQCHLETGELWERFHELGTEMIVTKAGR